MRELVLLWGTIIAVQCGASMAMVVTCSGVTTDVPHQAEDVIVRSSAIWMPPGWILLVRKGPRYAAVRFIDHVMGKTIDEQSAHYECWCQFDSGGSSSGKNMIPQMDEVRRTEGFGIGRLRFGLGKHEIECGKFRLFWSPPQWICFSGQGKQQMDSGIELAPTKWTKIEDVDVRDPRIKWYRYDEARRDITIPVERLW